MFPSSNTNTYNYRPFFNDITPNFSKQSSIIDHHQITPPDSNLFHSQLPSSPFNPCYDDFFPTQNGEFLFHQAMENSIFNFSANRDPNEEVTKNEQIVTPKKRGSKKDRHSKINTAKGPRDRRMRLSLKVAREFFDLQDKLCFDKASKTVEWLLLEARSAIKKLSGGISTNPSCSFAGEKTASSTSECEVVSGIEDEPPVVVSKAKTKAGKKEKAKSCSRKSAFNPQAKESREKARAKARERTKMKNDELIRKQRELEEANKINGDEFNQLSSWNIPFQETRIDAPINSPPLATPESITDESWAAIGKWSPFLGLGHIYNSGFPQEQNQIPIWE